MRLAAVALTATLAAGAGAGGTYLAVADPAPVYDARPEVLARARSRQLAARIESAADVGPLGVELEPAASAGGLTTTYTGVPVGTSFGAGIALLRVTVVWDEHSGRFWFLDWVPDTP